MDIHTQKIIILTMPFFAVIVGFAIALYFYVRLDK